MKREREADNLQAGYASSAKPIQEKRHESYFVGLSSLFSIRTLFLRCSDDS